MRGSELPQKQDPNEGPEMKVGPEEDHDHDTRDCQNEKTHFIVASGRDKTLEKFKIYCFYAKIIFPTSLHKGNLKRAQK